MHIKLLSILFGLHCLFATGAPLFFFQITHQLGLQWEPQSGAMQLMRNHVDWTEDVDPHGTRSFLFISCARMVLQLSKDLITSLTTLIFLYFCFILSCTQTISSLCIQHIMDYVPMWQCTKWSHALIYQILNLFLGSSKVVTKLDL